MFESFFKAILWHAVSSSTKSLTLTFVRENVVNFEPALLWNTHF